MILFKRAELLRLPEHLLEVVEREFALAEPGFLLGHLLLVELLLRLLDQGEHVAHAEDAAGHAVGMELLERIEMLARADELDRHAGDGLDRQRGAAAGVAVELRHDHAVKLQRLVERLRAVDGVLAGHRIDHQIDLIGSHALVDHRELVHQLGVDVQTTGGVEDRYVGSRFLGLLHRGVAEGDGVFRVKIGVDRQAKLLAEHLQLLDGGGTLQVGRHQQRLAAAGGQDLPELAAGRRLARTLQAAEHQHRDVAAEMERMIDRPHQADQLLVDDVNELLGGIERFENRFAHGLLANALHEVLDHRQADVGLQQRPLDRLQAVAHVRFGEPSASA